MDSDESGDSSLPPLSDGEGGLETDYESLAAKAGEIKSGRELPTVEFDPNSTSVPADFQRQLGPYRIIEKVGAGGMGVVYRAQQNEPIRREVAIKFIKADRNKSVDVISRFEAERQALALMNHPNIATVFDAGTTEEGMPYFAMEWVEGSPLNQYCDEKQLSISDRLNLFVQVCEAVQHAHQKGIIHRDLKPDNILVTEIDGVPVPKVIDFGLAKAIGTGNQLSARLAETQAGVVLGTLAYMSPEQASSDGEDIDTRTDVYSLGVILYEQLAGVTPLSLVTADERGPLQVIKKLLDSQPPRPSAQLSNQFSSTQQSSQLASRRKISASHLQQILQGELDWIVMKSLEKERGRRYPSAWELACEIKRFLNNEPVNARPPSVTYRLKKFVGNNRLLVGMSSAAILLLIVGTTVSILFGIHANRQKEIANQQTMESNRLRDEAQSERDVATEVSRFLTERFLQNSSVLQRANLSRDISRINFSDSLTIKELLELAAEEYAPERIGLAFPDRPEVQAAILTVIANAFDATGEKNRAMQFAEAAVDRLSTELGDQDVRTNNARLNLFFVALAAKQHLRAVKELSSILNAMAKKYEQLEKSSSESPDWDRLKNQAEESFDQTINTVMVRMNASRYALPVIKPENVSAELILQIGLAGQQFAALRQLIEDHHGLDDSRSKFCKLFSDMVVCANGMAMRSLPLLRRGIDGLDESLMWANSWPPEHELFAALLWHMKAHMLERQGQYDEAIEAFRRANRDIRELLPVDHPTPVMFGLHLGDALCHAGKTDEGYQLLIELLPIHFSHIGAQRTVEYRELMKVSRELGKEQQTLDALKVHRDKMLERYGAGLVSTDALYLHALASKEFRQFDEALELFRELAKMADHPWFDSNRLEYRYFHAELLFDMGDHVAAAQMSKRDQERFADPAANVPSFLRLYHKSLLVRSLHAIGEVKLAIPMIRELISEMIEEFGTDHREVQIELLNHRQVIFDAEEYDLAIELGEKILSAMKGTRREFQSRRVRIQLLIGDAYFEKANYEQALEYFTRGVAHCDTFSHRPFFDDLSLARLIRRCAFASEKLEKLDESEAFHLRCLRQLKKVPDEKLDRAKTEMDLASLFLGQKRNQDALERFRSADELLSNLYKDSPSKEIRNLLILTLRGIKAISQLNNDQATADKIAERLENELNISKEPQ